MQARAAGAIGGHKNQTHRKDQQPQGDWTLNDTLPATFGAGFGPIRIGRALMVYLDLLNRRNFLAERENAIVQQ